MNNAVIVTMNQDEIVSIVRIAILCNLHIY